jgi:hypothetical protein
LEPGYFFRLGFVGGADQMPAVRAGGGQDPFEFQTGDDIVRACVSESVIGAGIKRLAAGRQHNPAHIEGFFFSLIIKVDGIGRAELFTGFTFAADEIDALIGVDGVFQRYGLSILYVNRLAFGQSTVVCIGNFFGAFFRAQAAGDAFIRIHIARILDQLDLEIARISADAFYLGKGEKLDVDVPADLDQFG